MCRLRLRGSGSFLEYHAPAVSQRLEKGSKVLIMTDSTE